MEAMTMSKTYSELISFPTFEERFRYLQTNSKVGEDTFGFLRYLNQQFYHSPEWRAIRNRIIARDLGHDLAMPGDEYEIFGPIYIHHLNPIDTSDIEHATDILHNDEFLVCASFDTHNALHYGNDSYAERFKVVTRRPNDTCPWRH